MSKLFFVASILDPPRWVYDHVNQIIWPFLWGSRIETVARRSLICSVADRGLGLPDFRTHSQALRLSLLVKTINNCRQESFFLLKYFCGAQLASFRSGWASLRDNSTPSALSPSVFYSPLLDVLHNLKIPATFSDSSKEFFSLLLKKLFCIPMLHRSWSPFVSRSFSLTAHLQRVRDGFTENFKNDSAWLITLRAVKVRDSL